MYRIERVLPSIPSRRGMFDVDTKRIVRRKSFEMCFLFLNILLNFVCRSISMCIAGKVPTLLTDGMQWQETISVVSDEGGPYNEVLLHRLPSGCARTSSPNECFQSLTRHVDSGQLEFCLDGTAHDFLIGCWIRDGRGSSWCQVVANELRAITRQIISSMVACSSFCYHPALFARSDVINPADDQEIVCCPFQADIQLLEVADLRFYMLHDRGESSAFGGHVLEEIW